MFTYAMAYIIYGLNCKLTYHMSCDICHHRHMRLSWSTYWTLLSAQCYFECMIKDIRSRCGCLPGYMNLNRNDLAKSCSLYGTWKFHLENCLIEPIFLDHGKCVSPVLKKFDYLNCTCLQACETKLPTPQIIQYG